MDDLAWDEVSSSIVSGVDEVLSAFGEMDGDLCAIMDLIQASIIPTIQALADSMSVNAALIKAAWVGIKGTIATVWAALKPIVVGGCRCCARSSRPAWLSCAVTGRRPGSP